MPPPWQLLDVLASGVDDPGPSGHVPLGALLGAVPLVQAAPPAPAPAPVPTSFFGLPLPSGLPCLQSSHRPLPGGAPAPAPTTFFGIPLPSALPPILAQAPYLSPQR